MFWCCAPFTLVIVVPLVLVIGVARRAARAVAGLVVDLLQPEEPGDRRS